MALSDKYSLLIPPLTSNTSDPRFTISATNSAWGGNEYWKAFNGTNKHNGDCWHSDNSGINSIQVSFDKKYFLKGLFFWQRTDSSYPSAGVNINVYSSNDNSTWKLVTTFKNPSANGKIEVEFPSFIRCKYIKVQSTQSGYFTCGELNFYYIEVKGLLKVGDDYYSVKNENYDIDSKVYKPIEYVYENLEDLSFDFNDLFDEITINDETFKPIDKFDNFILVQEDNYKLKVLGTKSRSELIVANGDIDIRIAEQVNSLSLTTNQSEGTAIKMAISLDSGTTWNTISSTGNSFVPLDIVVPLKDYNYETEMTDEDKANYENAKTIILEQGIDNETLDTINFSTLLYSCEKIRFAYAIQTTEDGTAEIDKLQWNFDATGKMYKMNDNEVTVDIYEHSVLVTPNIDTDIMKTNIVF